MTLQISYFEGGNALGNFRLQQLLTRLQTVDARISGISARFVHLVAIDKSAENSLQSSPQSSAALHTQLAALLSTGDADAQNKDAAADKAVNPKDQVLVVVSPRLGTVSAWASKATDIAHNCGFKVRRIERLVEYRLSMRSGLANLWGTQGLNEQQW